MDRSSTKPKGGLHHEDQREALDGEAHRQNTGGRHHALRLSVEGGDQRPLSPFHAAIAYKRQYLIELHRALEDGRLDSNDAETVRRILIFHDEILSLNAESDKLFREESEQDEEIKMIKQEKEPAGMLNRWALQAEREKTRQAEEMAKQERERADKAEREVALLKAEIEALRSRE